MTRRYLTAEEREALDALIDAPYPRVPLERDPYDDELPDDTPTSS